MLPKHFASTVYIVAKIDGELKVLLHKHPKFNKWFAIGGHVEENESPYEAAIREVKEETRLIIGVPLKNKISSDLVEEVPSPVVILEEQIPKHKDKPAHIHIDIIYFAFTTTPEKAQMIEEFNWFGIEEIEKSDFGIEVKTLGVRAIKSFKKI